MLSNKYYFIFSFLFLSTLANIQKGNARTYFDLGNEVYEIEDLSNAWYEYDDDTFGYDKVLRDETRMLSHVFLPVDQYDQYFLSFRATKGLMLFIDGRLSYNFETEKDTLISIKEFKAFSKDPVLKLSFFHEEEQLPYRSLKVVNPQIVLKGTQAADLHNNLISRNFKTDQYLVWIMCLIAVSFLAYLHYEKSNYLKAYSNLASLIKNDNPDDDYIVLNPLTGQSLLLFWVLGIMVTIMVQALGYNIFGLDQLFDYAPYIFLPFIIGSFFWIKLVYLRLVSMMFGIKGYFRVHFFEFIRFSFLALLCITVLLFLFHVYDFPVKRFMENLLLFFMVIWGIKMFVRLRRDLKFPNIYIISYLCTSEILPLIIFIKQLN